MKPDISFDDFLKLDLRIACIFKVEHIKDADNLYKIHLDVGGLGKRAVVAGIKPWYKIKDLEGQQVLYLANLEPKVLRGEKSQGMIIAAGKSEAVLLQPDKQVLAGEIVR
jgi:methionyl-tRNA synthetase